MQLFIHVSNYYDICLIIYSSGFFCSIAKQNLVLLRKLKKGITFGHYERHISDTQLQNKKLIFFPRKSLPPNQTL